MAIVDLNIYTRELYDSGDQSGAIAYMKTYVHDVDNGARDYYIVKFLDRYKAILNSKNINDADIYNKDLLGFLHGEGTLPININILDSYCKQVLNVSSGMKYITYVDFNLADANPFRPIQIGSTFRSYPVPDPYNIPAKSFITISPVFLTRPGDISKLSRTVISYSEKIPVAGQIIKTFDTIAQIGNKLLGSNAAGVKMQNSFNIDHKLYFYDYMDEPYFRIVYTDANWTGIDHVTVEKESTFNSIYKPLLTNGITKDGIQFFPNVWKKQLFDQIKMQIKMQIEQQKKTDYINLQSQAFQLQQQKQSSYGPFAGIVNWLNSSPTVTDLKSGTTQLGQKIKDYTTTAGVNSSSWSPWAIGVVAVIGAGALMYVILED